MSLTGFIKGRWRLARRWWLERRLVSGGAQFGLERGNWRRSLEDPNGFYLECQRFFLQQLPSELREHRRYFQNLSGKRMWFGEDTFHTMWYLLLEEFKPGNFLEIGIFRGQVISLVALWAQLGGRACEVHGISPFTAAGDSVSKYLQDLDYYRDTLANFEHFNLSRPNLLRAYSTDAEAVQLIGSKSWDLIYIDGNHDYEVARQDWDACSQSIRPGGIIVLDDSALNTRFEQPVFASRGHPGPSRVAEEIDRARFREVLQVGHNRAFQKIG
jgi:Methyltransferase domain